MMMAWRAAKLATRVHLTGSSMLPSLRRALPFAPRCVGDLSTREVNV